MAESASKVYDLVYPSPIPLKDLSSIAVAIELWRLDLKEYLKIGNFQENLYEYFEPKPKNKIRSIVPDLPSIFHEMTEKYLQNLTSSTNDWLCYHYESIFTFHRHSYYEILKDFDDIVCDYDGSIDYVRTAKRMMLCDGISQDEKFKIACTYSFAEDIMRIGPSVQSKVNLEEIDFYRYPCLYYWVCWLRNEFDKIPNEENIPIANLLLSNIFLKFRSSFEYFWELAELEIRYQKAVELCMDGHLLFFGRFVLPKLNEEQFIAFVDEKGCDLIYYLCINCKTREIILAIWTYIKDKMSETNFATLIEKMLSDETRSYFADESSVEKSEYNEQYHGAKNLATYCGIWFSASYKLKRSAIEQVLPSKWVFEKDWHNVTRPRPIRFLLIVLLDMSSEERTVFWHNNWSNLLCSTRAADLDRIMKLCFADNDDEISRFKKETMAKYENLAEMAQIMSQLGYFKELSNVFNSICCNDEQSKRDMKQKCLQSNFLGEHPNELQGIIFKPESLHEFIDGAYGNLASEFRNQFLSAPGIERQLSFLLKTDYFFQVKLFVDSFASLGHNVDSLKERFAHELREFLIEGNVGDIRVDSFRQLVLWCLGSDDGVTKFKQSISPPEVLRNMVEKEISRPQKSAAFTLRHPCIIPNDFLSWYFDTQEKVDEFKVKYANLFKMFAPPLRRRF